jgi:hypothetical protein
MAVDIKDHRKFVDHRTAEMKAEAAVREQALLAQAPSTHEVGDERLDKLVRVVQEKLNVTELHLIDTAHKGMGAFKEDIRMICQLEYMFHKGKTAAYQEIQLLPAQIVMEEKGASTH